MEFKIVGKKSNPVLKRQEIVFEAGNFNVTPSRKELREKIASETGAKADLIAIGRLKHWFGVKALSGTAMVYEDNEAMKKTELAFIVGRTVGEKAKKKKEEK